MKIKILTLLFLSFIVSVNAEEQNFTGKIIDKNTNEPVFGAVIYYKGKPISFSDESGCFQFELNNASMKDSLTICHMSYENNIIPITSVKSGLDSIYVKEKVYLIDEVLIGSIKDKNVLKEIKKHYQLSVPQLSHWTEMNCSQLITYRGKPRSFLECFGNMLIIDDNEKYPDKGAYFIPSELRRTVEDPLLSKITIPKENFSQRMQITGYYTYQTLMEYHYFEICHPLKSRFSDRFEFHLDSICVYNTNSCYLFSFKQKNRISYLRNTFDEMKGQFWADVNNYKILKITCSFNHMNRFFNQVVEEYNQSQEAAYPKNISFTIIHNKYLGERFTQKIFIETKININKIYGNGFLARNYDYMIESFLPFLKYNREFWSKHPIIDTALKSKVSELIGDRDWDSAFEKGSSQKVFEDSKLFDSMCKKTSEKTVQLMKRDLKLN